MRRGYLFVATAIAAVACLAWLGLVATRESQVLPATTGAASAGPVPPPVASGAAGAPATPPPQPAPALAAPADPAAPQGAPPEVQEATDLRQSAKITRGMRSNPTGGIRVDMAPPGSVAGQMHLQPGDVLMSVNNEAVATPEDFARIYRAEGVPGEFVVIRDGREIHRR